MSLEEIKQFVNKHRKELETARAAIEQTRAEIDENADDERAAPLLWIRNQTNRLHIYQTMVEMLYAAARITFDSTVLRELRSYMFYAAQELGQLQHRGSATGGGDTASYELVGVDMEALR